MNSPVFLITGKKTKSLSLPKEIFAVKINHSLMAQAVRVYLSNRRQKGAKAKSRSEVTGSTRKIYRQKGTGRARHGAKTAPIFVGGGKAHGPTGTKNYQKILSKSMRQAALKSALSAKAKAEQLVIIDKLETIKPKTKALNTTINTILTKLKNPPNAKVSLILPQKIDSVARAAGNLKNVLLFQVKQLNTYQVLNGGIVIFTKPSIKLLKQLLLPKKSI